MKLTKHAHACVELELDGVDILIDPGEFEKKAEKLATRASAVLITHSHFDHIDQKAMTNALANNPDLKVFAPAQVAESLGSQGGRVVAVSPGEEFSIGSVNVKVVGSGKHAVIHPSIPTLDNVGYLIDDKVYHPGDSLDMPGLPVDILLLPVSGPWFKLSEAADFVIALKPQRTIPIHDGINSDAGNQLVDNQLGKNGITGIELVSLKPGKSIEV